MISALQVELTNLGNICTSYKPLILTVTQLLRQEPTFNEYLLLTDVPGEAFYLS